jgi:TolB-like protein/class 3 adenylate cyclase
MFTDIVGYSALTQRDEVLSLELLQHHRQLLRPLFFDHGGREVKTTGDGFLIEFASAVEALNCAVAMQTALVTHNKSASDSEQTQIRIGVHLGEVQEMDGDIYGDGVNIAARIEPLAEADGICISEDVARQVRNKTDLPLISLGIPEMKNITQRLEVFRVVLPWLEEISPAVAQRRQEDAIGMNSIVVLPFVNMSTDPENEYFSDGLTEELINILTTVRRLKVISRTSAFTFKGQSLSLQQIGRQLGVDSVLEGSVRKMSNKVRITAQLIQVSDDTHLWSETYDRELDDIFEIQDDISRTIVDTLKVRLFSSDAHELVHYKSSSARAYDLYLRGAYFGKRQDKEALLRGQDYLEKSLQEDPLFVPAHVDLAHCYWKLEEMGYLIPGKGFSRARELLMKSLELDPGYPQIYWMMGVLAHFDWNWEGADRNFLKAIELDSNDPDIIGWYGYHLVHLGEFARGVNAFEKSLELDPLNAGAIFAYGRSLRFARQYDRAIEQLERALELDPKWVFARANIAHICFEKGEFEKALVLYEEEAHLSQLPASELFVEGTKRALGLNHDLANLVNRFENDPDPSVGSPINMMTGYMLLDDHEKTFEWLDRGIEEKERWLNFLKSEPLFDPIRNDPRYDSALERMGFPT